MTEAWSVSKIFNQIGSSELDTTHFQFIRGNVHCVLNKKGPKTKSVSQIVNFNEAMVKHFVEANRPKDLELRKKIDLSYRIEKGAFVIFELHERYDQKPGMVESEAAKFRYIKSRGIWKLYWMRGNLKWYSYDPLPEANTLEEILAEIHQDPCGCFFG